MRSLCRGVPRGISPKRSQSYRVAPVAIISIAQQARPKVMGQRLDLRAQLMTLSAVARTRLSPKRFWMSPVISFIRASELVLSAHPFEIALAPDVGQGHRKDREEHSAFRER